MTGFVLDTPARRSLSRALSQCARDASGSYGFAPMPPPRPRIGITGSPGAGKSSLIGSLAAMRAQAGGGVAVMAVDPTSPISQGSVLGDRIRMDGASGHPGVFIRSLPSRAVFDGLCDNMEALLRILERAGFGEIMLETVGAGQVQHQVRAVTDTVVMVLSPHAGDSIQAMKAGLMETADIYVVNKADLPDAQRSAVEIRATIARDKPEGTWQPPVILTSTISGAGLPELSTALDTHRSQVVEKRDADLVLHNRLRHHFGEVLTRKLQAAIDEADYAGEIESVKNAILDSFNARARS